MFWFALSHLFSSVVDFIILRRSLDVQKDIQILLLRQQARVLQQKVHQPKRFSRLEKMLLAVLVAKLKRVASDFSAQVQPILIFSPDTVLRWHRELVRRKWTFRRKASAGRPKITSELETLVLQLARENSRWGYDRIEGELLKLGYSIDRSTIRNLLKRHRLLPAPKRLPKSTWRIFLRHYQHSMLACDFFTVETLWLKTVYVFFVIELGTRRVHIAGCTELPLPTGSRNRHVNCVGHLKTVDQHFATSFTIGTRSSHGPLIRFLLRRTSELFIRRYVLRMPMLMQNAGFALSVKSASINSSLTMNGI